MNIDMKQLKEIIISASKAELIPRFNAVERAYKADGSVVTEADTIMQDRLITQLQEAYPDIGLLGEEMTAEQQQEILDSGNTVWCLDPVDGTSNFAAGLPYFSVSLALIHQGEVILAVVYDPIRDECFSAQQGQGAYLNNQKLTPKEVGLPLSRSIALVDFKRLTPQLATHILSNNPYASQRSLGSIALELCWIAAGRGHVYLHAKQHLWDYAAAQLILSEAGGHACTLEGTPLLSNQLRPCSTVAALDKSLFVQWRDYLDHAQIH